MDGRITLSEMLKINKESIQQVQNLYRIRRHFKPRPRRCFPPYCHSFTVYKFLPHHGAEEAVTFQSSWTYGAWVSTIALQTSNRSII